MPRRSKHLLRLQDVEVRLDGEQLRASRKEPPPPKPRDMSQERPPPMEEKEASSPSIWPDGGHPEPPTPPRPRPPVAPHSGHRDPGPSTRRPGKSPHVHLVSSNSKNCFYVDEICELHKKNQKLEATLENMQEVLNDLLQGKLSLPVPKHKENERERGEIAIPVDDGRIQLSTSNTPQTKYHEGPRPTKYPQEQRQRNNDGLRNEPEVTSKEAMPDLREELNGKRLAVRTTPPVAPPKDREKRKGNPTEIRDSLHKRRQELDTEMRSLRSKITTASGGHLNDEEFNYESPFSREIQLE
ncbi:uncharacterized protein LOC133824950 [Humulus lupulus]|uniref:uncharacterized protein LOC133824950 n=1 Tax=Humulus lupulus TaxID=3486 RepID=UPI002B40F4EC|nr:uncharacterized protein LOC133824950 [Humulus lupulus]